MAHILGKKRSEQFWCTIPNLLISALLPSLYNVEKKILKDKNFPIIMNIGVMFKCRDFILSVQHWFKFKQYFLFSVPLQTSLC